VASIVDRDRLFSGDTVGVLLVCHRGSLVVGGFHAMDYRQRLGGTDWGRIWSRCRQKLERIASSIDLVGRPVKFEPVLRLSRCGAFYRC
jgi:hypothetical protein